MELSRLFYCLLFTSSLAVLFYSGVALAAPESCMFQRGETSVAALCEQGCCQNKCCTTDSSDDNLTILIIVCIVAGLIIIALIIIFLVYFVKDRKEDKNKELAETAARGSPPPEEYDTEDNHRQHSPSLSSRRGSILVTSDNDHIQLTRCKSGTRRNSSARPSDVSHDKEHGHNGPKSSSPRRSSWRQNAILVHEQDLRVHESGGGGNTQERPMSTPSPSRRKTVTRHQGQESPQHDFQSRRNSQARHSDAFLDRDHPLSSSLRPVSARKKNTSVHFEQEVTQEEGYNSWSRRSSKARLSDAFLQDEDADNSPVSSSSPPTARRKSKSTLIHHDQERSHQGAGIRRNSKARTSDAFLSDVVQGETLA